MRNLLTTFSLLALGLTLAPNAHAQNEFYNDGADVYVQVGGLIFVQGDVINDDQVTVGRMYNSGDIQLTGNWSNTSAVSNVFQGLDPGTVTFLGNNALQTIGGSRDTYFNNLTINKPSGVAEVRQLRASACDQVLNLTNDFLNTQTFEFTVANPNPASIQRTGPIVPNYTNTTTQGYVTSTSGSAGRLVRGTNFTAVYLFPVGTAARFRPVEITPTSVGPNAYRVQFVDLPTPNTNLRAATLATVNPAWYHFIERGAPIGSPENIRIYHDFTADDVCDIANVTMTEFNGGLWDDLSPTTSTQFGSPTLSWTQKTGYPGVYPTPFATNQFALAGLFFAPGVSSCVFPVELTQLRATPLENSILVSWQAQSQTNNAGWFVERSVNGQDFDDVGWRQGAGSVSTAMDYDLDDMNVIPGVLYFYRLRQLDQNGGTSHSEVVTAMLPGDGINIGDPYPNPSGGIVNLPLAYKGNGKLKVAVVNMLGQQVFGKEFNLMEGFQVLTMDLSTLAKGVYQLNFQIKGIQASKKLVLE